MKLIPLQSICLRSGTAILAGLQVFAGLPTPALAQASQSTDAKTTSPIKHVIVIIGENRTFDHVFATYKPKGDQHVDNLLSKHIINADGTPGPHYWRAHQDKAIDMQPEDYEMPIPYGKSPYKVLPPPLVGGPTKPYISSLAEAKAIENGLPDDQYYTYLTTGGTGLPAKTIDTRIPNATSLPPGPFQLTPGVPYDAYAASPVHRFYQMWQQLDCNPWRATRWNNSGCQSDLFPWVEVTVGAGSNGKPQPSGFNDMSTGEGSTSMGFYNVQQGDAPYLKYLADNYAMSDNFHQAGSGGTGINHILLGYSDDIYFSDPQGNPATPPANQIENPNPQPGTNNYYTQDGYSGGSYSNCSDPNAPGASEILQYEANLPYHIDPKCQQGAYYILNNYNPGYFGNGNVAYGDPKTTAFTIPPVTTRNIGNALLDKNISFKYYGDQWNRYVNDPYGQDPTDIYCNICNFLQYSTSFMTDPAVRDAHIQDTTNLYSDIQNGTLPAVSWVKPSGLLDGHPASSKLDLYEGFVKKIVDMVQSNKDLWSSTAIFVTFDEGGGYYDSGYVQPVDFFGDGSRVPMIVVSPFTQAGHISHEYTDHVSLNKFIERNWRLKPVTMRSRDNLPNPRVDDNNPYVPTNSPAIGDMFDLFDFGGHNHGPDHGQDHGHGMGR
ncbi:alkaline phosphatase family protein [Occallatibacter riparius]|uniref:Phosphoesterase n=1 Tax=Occallatibacter riparius TaxID=1002689 RepID=A0A9J7BQ63_9BACT|nr:alkaline phosphatase family protein [Occallatibacter riparius]UWZ84840.1 phosphoesterase [Occallatibacter riparius]